ncbi:MAG: TraR/DksA family transcriptional regulator [Acidimicrobiales bacterium]
MDAEPPEDRTTSTGPTPLTGTLGSGPEPSLGQASGVAVVSIDEIDHLLDQVERALSRLDDGTYGSCESCGSPIDDAVLAEAPTEQRCGACEEPALD